MAFTMRHPVGMRATPLAPMRSRVTARVVCKAQPEEQGNKFALATATLMTTAMLSGAMMMAPEDAMAAKSGGRMGGSSGFKSRSAPAARSSTQSRTTVNNTTIIAPPVMAPPLFGGFGYGGFGYGMGMPFVMPFPFFGGLFQFFFVITLLSVVFSVIRNFIGSGSNNKGKGKDDGWGDL